jgi:hypothetical protein
MLFSADFPFQGFKYNETNHEWYVHEQKYLRTEGPGSAAGSNKSIYNHALTNMFFDLTAENQRKEGCYSTGF